MALDIDSLGCKVIDFIDIQNLDLAAEAVCEYLRLVAEEERKNIAPNRETAEYYAALGLQAYALWTTKPGNEGYRLWLNRVIEKGVDLYLKTDHPKRMRLIEDMSIGQQKVRELIRQHFDDAVDEYEIDGQRLDIYIPSEKLAIEYDGLQHYTFCPAFHKSEEDFEHQQWLDKEKERKCKEHGITLIRIRFDEEISWKTILRKVRETL